jgi:hypothetical protein
VPHRSEFNTKAKRMGTVIRITDMGMTYYSAQHPGTQALL